MHLVYMDSEYKGLGISVYDLCEEWDPKEYVIPIKDSVFDSYLIRKIRLAKCFGDLLHIVLDFHSDLSYVYLVNLENHDVKCIPAINDALMIVPRPYSTTCYSFTELQHIEFGDPEHEPISSICSISGSDESLQPFEKHLVTVKERIYCFVQNNKKQKLYIMILQEEKGQYRWEGFGDVACSMSLQLVFVFKDRMFVVLDKPFKESVPGGFREGIVEERRIWEFDMERKIRSTSYATEHFNRDPNLTAMVIPKHILY